MMCASVGSTAIADTRPLTFVRGPEQSPLLHVSVCPSGIVDGPRGDHATDAASGEIRLPFPWLFFFAAASALPRALGAIEAADRRAGHRTTCTSGPARPPSSRRPP